MATIGWFVLILVLGALCAGLLYRVVVRGERHTKMEYFLWLFGSSALLIGGLFLTFRETVAPLYSDILSAFPFLDPAGARHYAVLAITMALCWICVAGVLVAVILSMEKIRGVQQRPMTATDVADP